MTTLGGSGGVFIVNLEYKRNIWGLRLCSLQLLMLDGEREMRKLNKRGYTHRVNLWPAIEIDFIKYIHEVMVTEMCTT